MRLKTVPDNLSSMHVPAMLHEITLPSGPCDTRELPPIVSIRIVKTSDGLPIRTMGTARTIGSGLYHSIKSGAVHPWEGETEHLLAEHDEVVTRIVRSVPQPFRIEATTSLGIERHVVDWARLDEGGRWEILNAK